MKRGISPLIASVFLFGFAIVLGLIVFLSSANLNQNIIEQQERAIATAVILDLDAHFSPIPEVDCNSIYVADGKCKTGATSYYCILIENEENRKVNYMVKSTGDLGAEVCSPENFELQPFQSKVFAVGYNDANVGGSPLVAEVEAVLFLD